MKYHVMPARNDVFGGFFLDFNEPCTAVIVKKRTGTPSFVYYSSYQCSNLAQIIQLKKNIN